MDGMQIWPKEVIQYIKKLESKIQNLEIEIKDLKEKNKKLENKLRVYENPHTPSSKSRFKERIPLGL